MAVTLGKKIKALRLLRDMHQADLCKITGFSRPLLVEFEKDAALPSLQFRQSIENAFGLELDSDDTNRAFNTLAGS